MGLYATQRDGHGSSIANNTGLYWSNSRYVYCYSNSTSDRATIVTPTGQAYSSRSVWRVYSINQQSPSGITLSLSSSASLSNEGVFTCRMTSSSGQIRDMSFAIYNRPIGKCSGKNIATNLKIEADNFATTCKSL